MEKEYQNLVIGIFKQAIDDKSEFAKGVERCKAKMKELWDDPCSQDKYKKYRYRLQVCYKGLLELDTFYKSEWFDTLCHMIEVDPVKMRRLYKKTDIKATKRYFDVGVEVC